MVEPQVTQEQIENLRTTFLKQLESKGEDGKLISDNMFHSS